MRLLRTLLASGAVGLALAVGASAGEQPPRTLGVALNGTLRVTSGVSVTPRWASMRGVWLDTKVRCGVQRRLRVVAEIHYVEFKGGSKGRRFVRRGRFLHANCTSAAPTVGFTIRAGATPFACPSGRWKRGWYSFIVRTTEPSTRLQALAIVDWLHNVRC